MFFTLFKSTKNSKPLFIQNEKEKLSILHMPRYICSTMCMYVCMCMCIFSSNVICLLATIMMKIILKILTIINMMTLMRDLLLNHHHHQVKNSKRILQGVFFLWIQSGGCKSAILRSFKHFLYFCIAKYGRTFILILLIHMNKKKVFEFHLWKRKIFGGGSIRPIFWSADYPCFLQNFIQNIKIWKAGGLSENSGNLHQDRHKNFKNLSRNDWENWT